MSPLSPVQFGATLVGFDTAFDNYGEGTSCQVQSARNNGKHELKTLLQDPVAQFILDEKRSPDVFVSLRRVHDEDEGLVQEKYALSAYRKGECEDVRPPVLIDLSELNCYHNLSDRTKLAHSRQTLLSQILQAVIAAVPGEASSSR